MNNTVVSQAVIIRPMLSIVIPVYNGGSAFVDCLTAIVASSFQDWELIVVDDGSTDQSAIVAEQFGATVLKTGGRLGPGAARNLGAHIARADYLCFIDADCEAHTDTLHQLANVLQQHPDVDAVFGSYDDAPKASNFVAQYKNLFHHYVHQTGCENAATFWAGCGAVKRSTFLKLGGFDVQRYPRPSIEDIDLGYRIHQTGGKIYLAKQVQVKHHKAWTLKSLVKTDVFDRGIPWTQLLLSNESGLINDLNLKTASRVSVIAIYALVIISLGSLYYPMLIWLTLFPVLLLVQLNLDVYQFFHKKRGKLFVIGSIFLHWLYYLYSGFAFASGHLLYWKNQWKQGNLSTKSVNKFLKPFSQQA